MGGENDRAVVGAFGQLFRTYPYHGLQAFNNMGVVNDLVAHEDRGAPFSQRLFNDLDGSVDSRAQSSWSGQKDLQGRGSIREGAQSGWTRFRLVAGEAWHVAWAGL